MNEAYNQDAECLLLQAARYSPVSLQAFDAGLCIAGVVLCAAALVCIVDIGVDLLWRHLQQKEMK